MAQGTPVDHAAVSERPLRKKASFIQSNLVDDTYDKLLNVIPYKSRMSGLTSNIIPIEIDRDPTDRSRQDGGLIAWELMRGSPIAFSTT